MCNSQKYVCVKHKKQIFTSRITHIKPILMTFFLFYFKTMLFCCLLFLLFSLLNFDFTNCAFWYPLSIWETIGQIGKTVFTTEFVTVANTLNDNGLLQKKHKQGGEVEDILF